MSNNVLAQSATQLTVSNHTDWSDLDFSQAVERAARRKVNPSSMTRERFMLKVGSLDQGLISAVCADYRNHFTAIYSKTERLPEDVYNTIQTHVRNWIEKQLKAVSVDNVISKRVAFHINLKNRNATLRTTIVGEELLSLKEQKLAYTIAIGDTNRRMENLRRDNRLSIELEVNLNSRISDLTLTAGYIDSKIAALEKSEPMPAEPK
jgi:hypothetical protein